MSILGVIVRSKPLDVAALDQRLRQLPGVEVADRQGAPDGRLVVVIEESAERSAAATLGAVALWPEVLNTALVYEYSGPESPAPDEVDGYRDWRRSLADAPPASRSS